MTRRTEVKQLIYEILKDGNIHSTEELRNKAIQNGVINSDEEGVIRSVMHQLKNNDSRILTVGRGKYRMIIEEDNIQEPFERLVELFQNEIDRLSKIDWVNCSDEEIVNGREHIAILKKYNDQLNKIGKH